MNIAALDLCLVTQINNQSIDAYLQFVELAVKGGVTLVQLRDKVNPLSKIRPLALALKSLLTRLHIPFIINDHVTLALEIDADGVHIGQSDMPPLEARRLLGPTKIIGYSVESYAELTRANQLNCIDYIAASAVFPSQTKTDCKTIWNLDGLKQLVTLSKHPVLAIGGINVHNVMQVIRHGACGVAVVSALHEQANPFFVAKELIRNISKGKFNAV
ncbi:phosphomethylpyrimidine kinase/thiamin-phosphate pyrophosphorylase [Legionella busanensis]|uniref:Thiamine-phosphate synthase n=1 Tax=Legionella busanensis TaxID=190655 RepID=A0A378JIP5_9GAMM|nr:thiamine phosphate synthase [Legionella busanensis]STX51075.1 phosphomethylpyrimidine kinase/thiamin-phosphate pyrophosphorylase [Legionella busanensis]